MVILGVTVLMEALQMSLIFHSAVRLCSMLLDPMVLFQLFSGLYLSLQTSGLVLAIWRFSFMKQKITSHLSVKFLCFWSECGFYCTTKRFVDKNFSFFCITVIRRVLMIVQKGRELCLPSGEA
jgi:hypothetical protein